jgi:enoyl-CoA hydratase
MSEVTIERPESGVAIVRMTTSAPKNAFTGVSAVDLLAAIGAVAEDTDVAVMILAGTEEAFCAGAHRDLLAAVGRGEPSALRDIAAVYDIFDAMRTAPIPIIAAVRGPAVGAGLNLVLAADIRIIADDAYLRSMFHANAIHPGGAHLKMLHDIGGREAAAVMALLDEPITGADFAARGWAWQAVPATQVEASALALARRAARNPALTRLMKATALATVDMPMAQAAQLEGTRQQATLSARQSN